MSEIICTCTYCGEVWEKPRSSFFKPEEPECPKCGDKNPKFKEKDKSKTNIFGYDLTGPMEDAYIKKDNQ